MTDQEESITAGPGPVWTTDPPRGPTVWTMDPPQVPHQIPPQAPQTSMDLSRSPQASTGLGAPGDTPATPTAPIVVSTPAVAPVVVTTKQGVSFSAMILIAAGSALIGGVLVWMFTGQPELSGARENPKDKWGPKDQWVHVPPRKTKKKPKKTRRK